jgi:hypothetical protein
MKWLLLVKTRLSFGSARMAEGIVDCGLTYFYQIDRQTHLDNLEKLERRSSNK